MRRATILALPLAILAGVAACNDGTEPEPFESGTVEFDFAAEGQTSTSTWTATGSCGARGFDLGSATCAVGSEEPRYWAVLGVILNDDDTYDFITVAPPKAEGECTISPDLQGETLCTALFVRGTVDVPQEEVPTYLMSEGTITTSLQDGRIVGSFSGTAEDQTQLGLAPLVVTDGSFDVQFVR